MELTNYGAIARLEETSWWYSARRDLLRRTLRPLAPFERALDLGCGVGANLGLLRTLCDDLVAVDSSPEAVRWCQSRGFAAVLGDVSALNLPAASFDLVTCLDVLEHVDDAQAMREIRRVLRPGGLLVITVPAHPRLWSENDEYAHHLRRYRLGELEDLLCGLEQMELSYWNFFMYLPMRAYSALRRRRPARKPNNNLLLLPRVANGPLKLVVMGENRVRDWIRFPTGTSLVALARQPMQGRKGALVMAHEPGAG